MEEIKEKTQGFYIQDFMRELGLCGAMLSVYALIYSFSVSASGIFYGSQSYAAERVGISVRSVQRAIKALLERGLIEKSEKDGRKGLCAVAEFYSEKSSDTPDIPEVNANLDRFLYESEDYDSHEFFNEYEDGAGRVINEKTEGFKNRYERLHRFVRPKYEKLSFGHEGMVALTREQYDALRKLIDHETLTAYLTRYECMLKEKMEKRRPFPKNAYLVLRKWIEAAHAV